MSRKAPPKKPAAKKPAPRAKKAAVKPQPKPPVKPAAKAAPVPARKQAGRMTAEADATGLTPNMQRFVREYLIDLNGTQAYMRVFPEAKEPSARVQSCRMLANPNVAAAIIAAKRARSERTEITADVALQHVWGIATADVRELVEHHVGCCRFCHGKDNRYQRTAHEFERDEAQNAKFNEDAIKKGEPVKEFDPQGGIGFDKRAVPNPDCPECFGEGIGRTVFKDTRNLSPGAAALFAGVKETKDGLEVKVHSKNDALEKVFKHLGLYEKDNKQKSLLAGVSRDRLKEVVERLSGDGG